MWSTCVLGQYIQSKDITDVSGISQINQKDLILVGDKRDIMDTIGVSGTQETFERDL